MYAQTENSFWVLLFLGVNFLHKIAVDNVFKFASIYLTAFFAVFVLIYQLLINNFAHANGEAS